MKALAICYIDAGKIAAPFIRDSVRLLRSYLAKHPGDGEARCYLGLALERFGYHAEALAEMRAASAVLAPGHRLAPFVRKQLRALEVKAREDH